MFDTLSGGGLGNRNIRLYVVYIVGGLETGGLRESKTAGCSSLACLGGVTYTSFDQQRRARRWRAPNYASDTALKATFFKVTYPFRRKAGFFSIRCQERRARGRGSHIRPMKFGLIRVRFVWGFDGGGGDTCLA